MSARLVSALLVVSVFGCGGAAGVPIDGPSNGWSAGGKADQVNHWSTEAGLDQRMNDEIMPYFYEHAQEGVFTGVDGVPIDYVALIHSNETGALVISSGRTESYLKYAELAWDLRDVGVSIYIMDHRGQGFSGRMLDDPDKGYVRHFQDYVTDFATFMDTVVMATPHPKVFGLAHSMGGAILATYLEQYPGMFDAVVLSSPMLKINSGWLGEPEAWAAAEAAIGIGLGKHYAIGHGPYDPTAANDVSHSTVRYAINEGFEAEYPEIQLGGPTYRWVEQAIEGERAARGDAAKSVQVPILLLQAGADQVVLPDGQDTFCTNAPHCTLQVIPGAGHEILQERDAMRDQALDAISGFFAAH